MADKAITAWTIAKGILLALLVLFGLFWAVIIAIVLLAGN